MTTADACVSDARDPSPGLFMPALRSLTDEEAIFSIGLDAHEPYLDDHRPGGDPLFSTVMAIEAAVTGARFLAPHAGQASVTHVEVYKPYILAATRPNVIDLRVVRSADASSFHCSLSSVPGGEAVTHLQADVRFDHAAPASTVPLPTKAHTRQITWVGPGVPGARVYELFFHGPSFQVIGEAQYRGGQMLCRLKQDLPPSHRHTEAVSQTAPRLIEFALQSAGLLEVAAHGRMKIPHSIGSIERFIPVDVDAPATLFAEAAYGSSDAAYIDVDIVDGFGHLVMSIKEYRTVVLPFAVSAENVLRLCAQLRPQPKDR